MVKLKNVQAYPIKDVPDYLIENCQDLGKKMAEEIHKLAEGHDPNIILGAVNFMHAALLKTLISDDPTELRKALQLTCFALMKNIDHLIATTPADEKEK